MVQILFDPASLPFTIGSIREKQHSVELCAARGNALRRWERRLQKLHGRYETVTFDFRGHGKASQAMDYSFEAFLSDAETVMSSIDVAKPIVVGWSLGADVAVEYAAMHTGTVAGLVIVDGAVPPPEPLVEDAVGMRRSLNSPIMKLSMLLARLTPYGYALTGDAFADITLELDRRRRERRPCGAEQQTLARWRSAPCRQISFDIYPVD